MKLKLFPMISGLALALMLAGGTNAQEPKGQKRGGPPPGKGGGPGGDYMAKLADDLKLTTEQRTQYDAAAKATSEKMRSLHKKKIKGTLEQKEVLRLALEYHKELTAKMKALLTPEQFAKWEPAREAHHKEVIANDKKREAGKNSSSDKPGPPPSPR